jgi:hypothetical protein
VAASSVRLLTVGGGDFCEDPTDPDGDPDGFVICDRPASSESSTSFDLAHDDGSTYWQPTEN